jgi:hypothetical protein
MAIKKMQAGGNTTVTVRKISSSDPYEVAKRKLQKDKLTLTKKRDLLIATAKNKMGKMAKGGSTDKNWIQKAVNPAHKGFCTPMSKPTCTPKRKALAKTFKAMAKKK